jgi:hypothetical protein
MQTQTATVLGTTGKTYALTLRFRGEIEQKTYSGYSDGGATAAGDGGYNPQLFISGGSTGGGTWNIYSLSISDPAQTYYLNSGSDGIDQTWLIDYRVTVLASSGATVTLTANSVESIETQNRDSSGNAQVVPGVPPDPNPYDGQFVQMDVEAVVPQ